MDKQKILEQEIEFLQNLHGCDCSPADHCAIAHTVINLIEAIERGYYPIEAIERGYYPVHYDTTGTSDNAKNKR